MSAYTKQIVGAVIGIIAALLMLFFGFWKGVLVIVLGLIGWWLAGDHKIPGWLTRFMDRIKNQNQGM